MRQVNLKILRSRLTEELKDLPFEITKFGHVIGVVSAKGLNIQEKGLNKTHRMPTNIVNNPEEAAEKLTEIIKKKQGADISKTDIATGGRPAFGYPKSYQARKKGK